MIQKPNNHKDLVWHFIDPENPKSFPKTKEYILLSFLNYPLPVVGRCEGDEDEGFSFYSGDDAQPLAEVGAFVNAWMPLPERAEE